jgi:cyclic beta-1,2-glucan synthetase
MPNKVPLPGAEPGNSTQQNRLPQGWVEELALNLGDKLETIERSVNPNPVPARLKALGNILQSAYRYFDDPNHNRASESIAAEWVLDNYYVIKQALRQINQNLPNNFYRRLPKVNVNNRKMTRIYVLASTLTNANQSRHNIDQIRSLIQTFQTVKPLTIGELWSLAPMLRLSALESIASALIRITKGDSMPAFLKQNWPEAQTTKTNLPAASDDEIVANGILSLRLFATQDWQAFFESTSLVEDILRQDPAKSYSRMSFGTRNHYRSVIEELSRGSKAEEAEVARAATQLSRDGEQPRTRHVGYYLIGSGRPRLERQLGYEPPREQFLRYWLRRYPTFFYLISIAALTILLWITPILYAILGGGSTAQIIVTAVLTFLPVFSVAVDFVNWLSTQIVAPHNMPRLDFKKGIPPEFSCMVVIPSLLKNETELESLIHQLENYFLGNSDPSVRFALLTDFVDASQKTLSGEIELIEKAKNGIEHLNARYINEGYAPFYLFHRERVWNPSESVWMGWERKRGKLHEFNRLIRGESETSIIVQTGDLDFLPRIRYVLTLDADTLLPRESVRRLTGIFAHPLNQAEFDPQTGVLVDGYTILQPRVQVKPTIANRSLFTRVYSGDTTFDLYTRAVSDVYQDLFGEGSYVGKGIYDVKAFEHSLKDRVPDNTLLSHDLFEGILGRCGLATNVILFEDFPSHYISYTHRRHRWIRGDWQLLPWLMPEIPHRTRDKMHSDLSALDRWKLFDNLRRSLTSPAILALIFGGWLFLPGMSWFWIALALFPYLLSTVFGIIAVLRARREDQYPEATSRPVQQAVLRSLLQIVFLPHEAIIALDAIATTFVRMAITHKRLLQWVTAAHTVSIFGRDLKIQIAWNEMMFAPFISLFLFFVLVAINPMTLWQAMPFLVTWTSSPYIAARISQRYTYRQEELDSSQTKQLHLLARATWLYFERFVGPEDHWLPPDHFQEEPRGIVAHRTSPTNIGLLLLSTLSAYDLGYIGLRELAVRIRNTFDGMDKLEKQRDHFLNWYDTRTLEPLPPRYISTVDSGNLAASLVALRKGCMDVRGRPIMRWDGLIDTLDMLDITLQEARLGKPANKLGNVISTLREQAEKLLKSPEDSPKHLMKLFDEGRVEMEEVLAKIVEASAKRLDSQTIRRLSSWIERTRHHLQNIQSDMEYIYPWPLALSQAPELFKRPDLPVDLQSAWNDLQAALPSRPSLDAIPAICDQAAELLTRLRSLLEKEEKEAIDWCETFTSKLRFTQNSAGELLEELSRLGERAESYVQAMNFRFLYNPRRRVFHIGYNVDSGIHDSSYYDLLASEARLTSLVAIAKGDVPQSHWLYLARPITQLQGMRTLLSWSGTMFEYLMPILLTKRYRNTLLDQSCRAAVEHQISYNKQDSQTPWGVSESGFYYFDSQQAYQYRAFGVPGLGYKRGLGEDFVVTPYASVLALPYEPRAVIENLGLFQKLEMFGLYGLYEAIDFTEARLATGQDYAIVRSYMAHHQGMIMLSLCNFLRKDIMVQRFHADPHIETVNLLLQEDIPVDAPIEYARPEEIGHVHSINAPISLEAWQAEPQAHYPQVHFLSNGNYGLLITAAGSGYSQWRDVDLTRWRADTTLNHHGTWIYIQDLQTGRLWSTTYQPTAVPPDKQDVRFSPHAAAFMRRDKDITSQMRVTIAADADVEIRHLSLTNHDASARDLVLTSFAEVILSSQWVDQRHPAYNKLFIESEYLAVENILLFRRRPRSADDKPVYLAHFIVDEERALKVTGYETDRGRFLGRGHTPRDPAVLQLGSGLIDMTDTLDPIFALQTQISVPGYDSRQLAFITLAASSREEALDLARRYRQWHYVTRAFTEVRTQAEQELIQIGLSSPELAQVQKLLSALLYPAPILRSDTSILARNNLGQSGLWAFGISGDYPILLLLLKEQKDLGLLNELLRAHHYWRKRNLKIDLVIINRRETSYDQNFQGVIYRLLRRTSSDKWLGKRGGIFVLREDQMSEAEQVLLATVARVVLDGEAGTLSEQLQKLDQTPIRLPRLVPLISANTDFGKAPAIKRPADLLFDNGTGGFTPDGREYVIYLERGQWTPVPWTNVIANPEFGFLVTEAGMGCTWAINSGENRLTPWHNDPVSDPPAEAIYMRDEDTGEVWSPTPLPARADAPYLIRHGMGYSVFEHASHHLDQSLKIFVVPDAPLKLVQLKLKNTSSRIRRINVSYYAEWVLGKTHENTAQYIVPEFASEHSALLATNSYNTDFSQRVAFLAATRELQGLTTDRSEFLASTNGPGLT